MRCDECRRPEDHGHKMDCSRRLRLTDLMPPRDRWEITYLKDHGSVADRRVITVDVVWHDAEGYSRDPQRVTFTGPSSDMLGGLVVMCLGPSEEEQHYVADPGRFGEFGPDWVRRFYGVKE